MSFIIQAQIFVFGPGYVVFVVSITDDSKRNLKRSNNIEITKYKFVQVLRFLDNHKTKNENLKIFISEAPCHIFKHRAYP
jgi:hypothetical protein